MRKYILIAAVLGLAFNSSAQGFNTMRFINGLYQADEYIKRQNKGIDFKEINSYTGTPYNDPNYLLKAELKEVDIFWFYLKETKLGF